MGAGRGARSRAGLAVTALAFVLYLATLSRHYTGDSIEFAQAVEHGGLALLSEPHQLLNAPLGWAFCRLWQLAGWSGRALLPLQVFNALAGALAVGFVWAIGRSLTGNPRIALWAAGGFAFSCGTWLLSTDAEFATVPLAVSIAVLWLLLTSGRERRRQPGFAISLGLLTGLASLVYLTNALLAPVVLAGVLLDTSLRRRERLSQSLWFLGSFVLTAVLVYLLVTAPTLGTAYGRIPTPWHGGAGRLYGIPTWRNLPHGAYAFLRSLAGYPGLGLGARTGDFLTTAGRAPQFLFAAYYAIVLLAVLALARRVLSRLRALTSSHRRELAALAVWALLHGAFAVWWLPGDLQFWLPVLAPWWLVTGLALATDGAAASRTEVGTEGRAESGGSRLPVGAVAFVGALLIVNGLGVVRPNLDLERNRAYQIAASVAEETTPDDLIITTGGDGLFQNIPYFAGRRTVPLLYRYRTDGGAATKVWEALEDEMSATIAAGGHVYFVGFHPGRDVRWDDLAAAGISPPHWSHLTLQPAWEANGETMLEIEGW